MSTHPLIGSPRLGDFLFYGYGENKEVDIKNAQENHENKKVTRFPRILVSGRIDQQCMCMW